LKADLVEGTRDENFQMGNRKDRDEREEKKKYTDRLC